ALPENAPSNGIVMLQYRRQLLAPSSAAASYSSSGIFCRPEYRITRLKGIPSQIFAMVTDTRDIPGEVSQLTGSRPNALRMVLTMPLSLLSIHAQVEAETIIGSSQGTRNTPRNTAESRKFVWKKTASASPRENWKAIDPKVNTAVFLRAIGNVDDCSTSM